MDLLESVSWGSSGPRQACCNQETTKNGFSRPHPSLTFAVCGSCDSCFCVWDLGESDSISTAESGPACASPSSAGPSLIILLPRGPCQRLLLRLGTYPGMANLATEPLEISSQILVLEKVWETLETAESRASQIRLHIQITWAVGKNVLPIRLWVSFTEPGSGAGSQSFILRWFSLCWQPGEMLVKGYMFVSVKQEEKMSLRWKKK